MDDDLTPEQTELLDAIEETEPSAAAVEALHAAIERFEYSASLLASLADWLREEGDSDGADIVLACSGDMALHEARTA